MLEQPLFHTIDSLGKTKHGLKPMVHMLTAAEQQLAFRFPNPPNHAVRLACFILLAICAAAIIATESCSPARYVVSVPISAYCHQR